MLLKGLKIRTSYLICLLNFKNDIRLWVFDSNGAKLLTSRKILWSYLAKSLWFPFYALFTQLTDLLLLLSNTTTPIFKRSEIIIFFPGQPRLLIENLPLLILLSVIGKCYITIGDDDAKQNHLKRLLRFLRFHTISFDNKETNLKDLNFTPNMYQWFKLSSLLKSIPIRRTINQKNVKLILKFRTDFHCANVLKAINSISSNIILTDEHNTTCYCHSDVFFSIPCELITEFENCNILKHFNTKPIPIDDYIKYYNKSLGTRNLAKSLPIFPVRLAWMGILFEPIPILSLSKMNTLYPRQNLPAFSSEREFANFLFKHQVVSVAIPHLVSFPRLSR